MPVCDERNRQRCHPKHDARNPQRDPWGRVARSGPEEPWQRLAGDHEVDDADRKKRPSGEASQPDQET